MKLLLAATLMALVANPVMAQNAGGRQGGRIDATNDPDEKYNWIKRNEFAGKKILVLDYSGVPEVLNYVPGVLSTVGFRVTSTKKTPAAEPEFAKADQVWVISGTSNQLAPADLQLLAEHVKRGKGLYVLADNQPWNQEAHQLCQKLHGGTITGDYPGGQLVSIVSRNELAQLGQSELRSSVGPINGRTRSVKGKNYVEDHEIFSGLKQIVEGYTVSHLEGGRDLDIILAASDGQPLIAVSTRRGEKVVFDCGFTRMYHLWDQNKVTNTRWYQNVAGYLMGKVRTDLPGRSSMMTMKDLAKRQAETSGGKPKPVEELTAADLVAGYKEAPAKLRREILQHLHDAKGGEFSDALAEVVGISEGEEQAEARKLLTARLARLTEKSLRAKLQAEDPEMVRAAIAAAVERDRQGAVGELIDLLVHADSQIGAAALAALKKLTQQDFGPAPRATKVETIVAQQKWRKWWDANRPKEAAGQ